MTPVPPPPDADPSKLALGERLFSDRRLSASGNLSCSSCHDLRSNGAGGGMVTIGEAGAQERSQGRSQGRSLGRSQDNSQDNAKSRFDTPTIFNAALSFRLDWEGNFRTFVAQAEASLESPETMKTTVDSVVEKLRADPQTVEQFRAAYGREPDRDNFLDALATFEQSLVTPGSRFDRWLDGDKAAMSDQEVDGYRSFRLLGCSSCHQGVNIGGNLMQRQGVFRKLVSGKPDIVRVPSLRNVAVTAPYFHDGSALTLEDAIRRMAAAQLDRTLSEQQVASLVAFLKTLTGNYRGVPVSEAQQ